MDLSRKLFNIKNLVKNISPDKKAHTHSYASPTKVMRTFNDLFEEFEIMVTPKIIRTRSKAFSFSAGQTLEDKTHEKHKVDILHTVDMVFTFEDLVDGEKIEVPWCGTGQNGTEQGFGSAITYGSRYFYIHYFGLTIDKDDPDALNDRKASKASTPKLKKMTAGQQKGLFKAIDNGNGALVKGFLADYEPSALKKEVEAVLKAKK